MSCTIRAELIFSGHSSLDIPNLNIQSLCGLGFNNQTQHLWISDGRGGNLVAEVDLNTNLAIKHFNVYESGIINGPDSLAVHPSTSNIFVSSAYLESKLAEFTPEGNFVRSFTSGYGHSAMTFTPEGKLILMDKDNGAMLFFDIQNNTLEKTVPLLGYSDSIVAADYDPLTGHIFGYCPEERAIIEVDIDTGQVISFTDMLPYLTNLYQSAIGIEFNVSGDKLYFSGNIYPNHQILVLDRVIPEPCTLVLLGFGALVLRSRKQHYR